MCIDTQPRLEAQIINPVKMATVWLATPSLAADAGILKLKISIHGQGIANGMLVR